MINSILGRYSTKLNLKDQSAFTKRLAFLIRADVPIIESLRMMQRQTKSKPRSKILEQVIGDVSSGQTLSSSLAKHRRAFGDFSINIIRVGEEAGILDTNLEYLSAELHKRQDLKKKIQNALVYPIFVTIATLGVSGLITAYVFPKILPIFRSLGATLPITTQILVAVSEFLLQYGFYLIGGLVLFGTAFYFLYKNVPVVNAVSNQIVFRVPIFGHLARTYHMANFCRTLGLLLNCQINIVSATNITADATSNIIYRREIFKLSDEITKGRKISQHLEDRGDILFPEMVPQMVSIGEATGNLGETLIYLGDYYESEVNDITKNLSSSLEPILLVVMGLVVGFVAVSVITPIYEFTQNLSPR